MNHVGREFTLRTFLPLIIIVSVIILLTIAKQFIMPTNDAHGIMLDFMGIFFLLFGSFKLINLKNFAEAYAKYDLIARRSRIYALAYPFIEVALGIGYIARYNLYLLNVLTIIIMLISAAGVATSLYKKEHVQCACLGMVFKLPMTYVTLAEDLLMVAMAGYMLLMH
jgi:hypothetical protein